MKENIHPKYVETKVTCGCGNTFTTRSTKPELKVDIQRVHPFTRLKFVDTAGRIEKFETVRRQIRQEEHSPKDLGAFGLLRVGRR